MTRDEIREALLDGKTLMDMNSNKEFHFNRSIIRIVDQCMTPMYLHMLDDLSLKIKPEKKVIKGWVNIYKNGLWNSKDAALCMTSVGRLAVKYIEIEYTEGEGLDDG